MLLRTFLFIITLLPNIQFSFAAADNIDLKVCLAYSDRESQISCCEEFEISDVKCTGPNQRAPDLKLDNDLYFYCKFQNLDGSEEDLAKWGKGTDFAFVSGKNIWEWRSKYTIQSIDSNGRYYQTALNPAFKDQRGRCGEDIKIEYQKQLRETIKKYQK